MSKLFQTLILNLLLGLGCFGFAVAQTNPPLTSKEVITLAEMLQAHPEKRDAIVTQIQHRGIGFQLTLEQQALISKKSKDDLLLKWTLEEAERRRANRLALPLSSEGDSRQLLERTRTATLAAAEAMPDFLVRQVVKRFKAEGGSSNWIPQDNVTLAVSYRSQTGEQYKVMAINGKAVKRLSPSSKNYDRQISPGLSSSGFEYISALANVFKPELETTFRLYGPDTIQARPVLVYEYEVKQALSQLTLRTSDTDLAIVGSRGRIWIDRELNRVLRFEQIAMEIPAAFPITSAIGVVDYGWVTIGDRRYLLPIHSELLLTRRVEDATIQSRNSIHFSGYQKFGSELKVIDEIDDKDPK